jgi:predicted enzyme related to lactoylglutathione lyase
MKIKLTAIYVTDQDKALRFYTEVLGFTKKADFSQGPFRWLTVTSPDDPNGTELQLAADSDPAGKAFAKAKLDAKQPAIMLFSDDIKADCDRIKAKGGELTMPPTAVTGSTIAMLADGCGNLVQISQITWKG